MKEFQNWNCGKVFYSYVTAEFWIFANYYRNIVAIGSIRHIDETQVEFSLWESSRGTELKSGLLDACYNHHSLFDYFFVVTHFESSKKQ